MWCGGENYYLISNLYGIIVSKFNVHFSTELQNNKHYKIITSFSLSCKDIFPT